MTNKNYKYYQPNSKDVNDKCGDCMIRSLTKFYNISWLEVFDKLVVWARESQTMINDWYNVQKLLESEGYTYTKVYKPKDKNKTTVLDFTKEHNIGTYLLYCKVGFSTHCVTVSNGVYHDTWDCGNKIVYGYYQK